ncbi:MAG: hypothetical protein RRC07_10895 [Anaerolineae bacterium]|nr:hypothetical protein [Anaerolineae bacterium]
MSRHDRNGIPEELALLAPEEDNGPQAAAAWAAFQARRAEKQGSLSLWRFTAMFNRKIASVAIAVLMLVAAFSFPPVRAAASDFLGLFRVQKFAPISVSPEQMALLQEIAAQGLHPGELVRTGQPGEAQVVGSAAEAEEAAGFTVRTIPSLGAPQSMSVEPGGSGTLVVDLEQLRAMMGMAGVDPSVLPMSLAGAEISVVLYPAVQQGWADGTTFVQMPSPEVDYPDEVDAAAIGEAVLQALGMSPAEAQRLSRAIDWTNTLVLPIPTNIASFTEVTVGGNSGLALTSVEGHGNAIVWQGGDTLYMLTGSASTEELLALADRME